MQDIMYHIHSLLPLRDAARPAFVSHVFLNSWRCRPNLCLSMKALGFKASSYGNDKASRDFTKIVDHILKKHSGFGLKTFRLAMYGCHNVNACHLDSWLHLALILGVEQLILEFPSMIRYNFPFFCTFRPTVRLGCFRSLKKLHLYYVSITGDELGCLLPNSVALEQLELRYCKDIICLKIPRVLLRLSCLKVFACDNLREIMSEAPNLSSLCFEWFDRHVTISLGEALHVKKLEIPCFRSFNYAQLPTIVPNLEIRDSITVSIDHKPPQLNTSEVPIPGETHGPAYDYLSVSSFLGASPCLETFILRIHVSISHLAKIYSVYLVMDSSIFAWFSIFRYRKPAWSTACLPEIPRFCVGCQNTVMRSSSVCRSPASTLQRAFWNLELACYVLETATSLERLELGTTYCPYWFTKSKHASCYLVAIRTYIEGKVPSTVRLDVQGPWTRTGGSANS
uniref:At1g61320/AtMIF1 LRR domain-containing protein n=1 Tax=Setaria italica TaxID=4555 RepID=K4A305_SETIT